MQKDEENIAQTAERLARKPIEMGPQVAVPEGWKMEDVEKYMATPRRKRGKVSLSDTDSFIALVKHQGSLGDSTIWCKADYTAGEVALTAVLNDHGQEPEETAWRDHLATFTPVFSEEWKRWFKADGEKFGQVDFAAFLEENLKDIATVEGSPTGAQMLEMALSFEANQDMRYKSHIRLQNGGVQMSFVQDDDNPTLVKMQVFDRFSIGIPVFWNGDAYQIDARLRYRVNGGILSFWYELIRADKTLEAAATTVINKIKTETGMPFFFGSPFA